MSPKYITGIVCATFIAAFTNIAYANAETEAQSEAEEAHFKIEEALCDHVFQFDHYIPVREDAYLHVVEKFTAASVFRPRHHAILMLTGSLATELQYNADIPGDPSFNALDRAAREGYFAFTATYEGYGDSSHPPDGKVVTKERLLGEAGVLVEWIRENRHVRKVDLIGASTGSSLAIALGSDFSPIPYKHIGKLILTDAVYKEVSPALQQTLLSPQFKAMFENAPHGYIQTTGPVYGLLFTRAAPNVFDWASKNFPGVYAVGPTLEDFNLPIFQVTSAHAPALQFWGDQDPIMTFSDVQAFQHDYSGPIELSILPGGGHAPYFEPEREEVWRQTFAFLNPHGRPFACEFPRDHR